MLQIEYHPQIVKYVERLVLKLEYSGFGECEFVLNEKGDPHLVDFNPRPVPYTHLGVLAGIHFGKILFENLYNSQPSVSIIVTFRIYFSLRKYNKIFYFFSRPQRFAGRKYNITLYQLHYIHKNG